MDKKKQYGQYFTPEIIAQFMVSFITKGKDAQILEPSAGKGIFLKVLKNFDFQNITAYEIDNKLENISSEKINYTNFLKIKTKENFDVIIGNPPYVKWKNIPVEIKKDLTENDLWKDKVNGLSDLLYPFFFHCINMLKPGGELIFITPLFWMETQHAEDLRKTMIKFGEFEFIITFHEMGIFKSVSSNIMIFKYIKKKENPPKNIKIIHIWSKKRIEQTVLDRIKIIYKKLNEETEISEDIYEAFNHKGFNNGAPWKPLKPSIKPLIDSIEEACINFSPQVEVHNKNGKSFLVSLNKLFEKYELEYFGLYKKNCEKVRFSNRAYYLAKNNQLDLFDFIANKNHEKNKYNQVRYTRLGDIAEIGNGMVSGLDEAFKINEKETFLDREKEKFIKVLKARNLTEYYNIGFTNYIFIYNENINEQEFKEKYPNFFIKQFPYKERLESRYNYDKDELPWWEWVYLRNKKLIENNDEKIFVPSKDRVDKRQFIRFAYAKGDYYATQDVTVIVKKPEFNESIKYILAILNSEFIFKWIKCKGLRRGGVFEFSERPLSIIPIRLINWKNSEEVKIHNEIIDLVNKIIEKNNIQPYKNKIEKLLKVFYQIENFNHKDIDSILI